MYIIMYKYSAFRINHKSFRSSMSKNFTVIPGSDRGSLCKQVGGQAILPYNLLYCFIPDYNSHSRRQFLQYRRCRR